MTQTTYDDPPDTIVRRDALTPAHALRDEVLAAAVAARLSHDRRTERLVLDVAVSGGVAHVTGSVPSEAERQLVRAAVRDVSGVLAGWDLITLQGDGELAIADIGCGGQKQVRAAVGVDAVAQRGVDIVANLDEGLPFDDASLDHVFAVHILEHVGDMVAVMAELHRVLKPTGVLHVLCPHWRHVNAAADPTHVRAIDPLTFRWFCEPARADVPPWRPLCVTGTADTVHADLQPVAPGRSDAAAIARWFS